MYSRLFCLARYEYTLYCRWLPSYRLLAHCWSESQTVFFFPRMVYLPLPARCPLQIAYHYLFLYYHLQKRQQYFKFGHFWWSDDSIDNELSLARQMHILVVNFAELIVELASRRCLLACCTMPCMHDTERTVNLLDYATRNHSPSLDIQYEILGPFTYHFVALRLELAWDERKLHWLRLVVVVVVRTSGTYT